MTPGPEIIIACPHCGALERLSTIEHAEPEGMISWTDGYQESPGVQRQPNVTRCQSCHELYWVAQAAQVGYLVPGEEPTEEKEAWRDLPHVERCDAEDFLEAIHNEMFTTPEQELEL